MKTIRTFVAIELAEQVGRLTKQLVNRMKGADQDVRWVQNDNLHLTLKFLGDIPNVDVHRVCQMTMDIAKTMAPFDIQTSGVGVFPNLTRPRTIWLGCDQPEDLPLNQLHESLDDEFDKLRVPRESRKYQPHVTVGRIKGNGRQTRDLCGRIESYPEYEPILTHVEELIVFGSFLDREGPTYNVLGRAPLSL